MRLPGRRTVLFSVLGAGALGLLGLGTAYALVDVPSAKASATQEASVLQYADGSELARVGALDRDVVPLTAVSEDVQHAVLAAEQRTYYSDGAISPRGIVRALLANVRGGGVRQGGSTITQQYVKNAYLSDERTYSRKVKEALVAIKLSHERSKAQILGDYLNTVYFGRGAYGVQVAAKTFFGKDAKDLDGAQGAVLAALLRSPTGYDPAKHPQEAKARWEYVLDGMVAQGWMTKEDRAKAVYPQVRPGKGSKADDRSGPRGYVVDLVESELAHVGFPEGSLQKGGLTVRTTIRKKAQAAAVGAVQDVVDDPGKDQHAVQGALVAVRPGTGEIVAYYGGRAGNGGFDYASQGPQDAGSTMKPYVLAAALDRGISLDTKLPGDSPTVVPGYSQPVNNFDDESFGEVDVVDATAHSINTAYVTLASQVGPQAVADTAHALGIRAEDRLAGPDGTPSLAIALGSYGVRVIDQAAAFATFADRGTSAAPFVVQSVKAQRGTQVYRAKRMTKRVLPEDVTADVTYALQQVVERGTAQGGKLDGRPAFGKTGTTSDDRDAWMVGGVPQLTAAVWMGRGDNQPVAGLTGGSRPARIWKAFLDAALQGDPVEQFPPRAGVGRVPTPSASPSPTSSPSPSPTPSPSPSPSDSPSPSAPAPEPSYDSPAPDPYSPAPSPAPTAAGDGSSPAPGAAPAAAPSAATDGGDGGGI